MRPKQFYLMAFLMFAAALSLPLQAMLLYGHHWQETAAITSKMTSLNWLVMFSLLLGSYFYFHASRFIVFLAPVILLLVAVNNYWVGRFAGDFSLWQTTLATFVVGGFFAPLLLPSSKAILRDPKRRWWRTSPRVKRTLSATINPYVGEMLHGHTFDISKTGTFIQFAEDSEQLPKVGEKLRLSLTVNSMKKVRCEAIVVRVTEPKGQYPKGLGLQFIQVKKQNEKGIQQILSGDDF